jgi:hypothetical protein
MKNKPGTHEAYNCGSLPVIKRQIDENDLSQPRLGVHEV